MSLIKKLFKKIKTIMLKNMHGMITCKEFDAFIQSYVDNELADNKRELFEWHLRYCSECSEYLLAYQRTIELSNAVLNSDNTTVSDDVPEELIKAILEARK